MTESERQKKAEPAEDDEPLEVIIDEDLDVGAKEECMQESTQKKWTQEGPQSTQNKSRGRNGPSEVSFAEAT